VGNKVINEEEEKSIQEEGFGFWFGFGSGGGWMAHSPARFAVMNGITI
jgi:hypothetical protein